MGMEELFQSVAKEHTKPIQTKITGTIPEWIEGSLYRNGPAKFEFGDTKYNHWFDGMAMLHRFKITKGEVTYQNRFIQSDVYRKNMESNRIVCSEFGTMALPDPCKTLFERVFSYFEKPVSTDNCVVNVFPVGEWLCAATETNLVHRIDPSTLESKEKVDLTSVMSLNGATAHPHIEPDGTIYNLGSTHAGGVKYTVVKITPPKKGEDVFCEKAEILAQVPSRWRIYPAYFHSFAMTPNYFILIEQPMVINVLKILTAKLRGKPFADAMEYYADHPVKFHIIDRRSNERVNADTDYIANSFLTFHHINAYEENEQLVVDTCIFHDPGLFLAYSLEKLQSPDVAEYLGGFKGAIATRFALPLKLENAKEGENLVNVKNTTSTAKLTTKQSGTEREVFISEDPLYTDISFDFPQINYNKYNGKDYRFIYGAGYLETQLDCIVKLDVETREMKTWHEPNVFPSEPVFVPSPNSEVEDDGVLLTMILTTGENRSAYLLVLDAKTLEEIGRAEAEVKIGRDTHGTFVANF